MFGTPCILADSLSLNQTIFIAGDCADKTYRQAITAAGMGYQAAIESERWLAEN